MMTDRNLRLCVIGLAATLALGACGGGGGGSKSTTISSAEAAVVGEVAASQINGMTSGLVNFNSGSGSLGGGFFAPASATGKLLDGVMRAIPSPAHRVAFTRLRQDPNCTPAVDDETDTDQDGVPDNATYTFNCSYTDLQDGSSFTVTGAVNLQDSRDVASGFGFAISLNTFKFALTFPGQNGPTTTEVVVNGLYNADVLSSNASAGQNVSFVFRVNNRRVFLSSWNWNIGFTPNGTIDFGAEDMPPGEFSLNGNFVFQGDAGQNAGDWAFSLNSTSPLVYDGTCSLEPPFASGQIDGAIVARSSVGFTVTYTGCGQLETITAFDNNA